MIKADDDFNEEKQYGYWHSFEKVLKKEQKKFEIEYLKKVSDYKGQKNFVLSCTQQNDITQSEQNKIVNEWIKFFKSEELPVEKLWMTTRISQKIFDAICCQKNIQGLFIKWGVYNNIQGLENLTNLEYLHLGGWTSLKSIETISKLTKLKCLETRNLFEIHDYSFLKKLDKLADLSIEGDSCSFMKKISIKSLNFLKDMPMIIRLNLHMIKVEDRSYAPILDMPNLKYLTLDKDKDLEKDIDKFEELIKKLDMK